MQEVDSVRVWVLTDNYYDSLRPDSRVATRYRVNPGECIHAEHGLAYFIETEIEGRTSACMFDFGLDGRGVLNNAKLLKIDLGSAEAFVLSHGHFDHWTGALEILRQSRRTETGTAFYTGDEVFLHRYSRRGGSDELADIGQLNRQAIQESGVIVREVRTPTQIIPGCYCTGKIERVTEYEIIQPNLFVERDGRIEADDFRGEQALFFILRSKGLVVLSGCAHTGIVNTVRQAQRIAGIDQVHAILGGFHLINACPKTIGSTVGDIKSIGPDYIAPAHCTGFEAITSFSRAMPGEFILSTAGTRYTFSES